MEQSEGCFRFPKGERLKRSADISALFRRGRSVSCAGARLFFRVNDGGLRRIAFAFSRKFGNAVQRNRARRLGREAYRHLRGGLKMGFDMVLLVYPDKEAGRGCGLESRLEQLRVLCQKARLMNG